MSNYSNPITTNMNISSSYTGGSLRVLSLKDDPSTKNNQNNKVDPNQLGVSRNNNTTQPRMKTDIIPNNGTQNKNEANGYGLYSDPRVIEIINTYNRDVATVLNEMRNNSTNGNRMNIEYNNNTILKQKTVAEVIVKSVGKTQNSSEIHKSSNPQAKKPIGNKKLINNNVATNSISTSLHDTLIATSRFMVFSVNESTNEKDYLRDSTIARGGVQTKAKLFSSDIIQARPSASRAATFDPLLQNGIKSYLADTPQSSILSNNTIVPVKADSTSQSSDPNAPKQLIDSTIKSKNEREVVITKSISANETKYIEPATLPSNDQFSFEITRLINTNVSLSATVLQERMATPKFLALSLYPSNEVVKIRNENPFGKRKSPFFSSDSLKAKYSSPTDPISLLLTISGFEMTKPATANEEDVGIEIDLPVDSETLSASMSFVTTTGVFVPAGVGPVVVPDDDDKTVKTKNTNKSSSNNNKQTNSLRGTSFEEMDDDLEFDEADDEGVPSSGMDVIPEDISTASEPQESLTVDSKPPVLEKESRQKSDTGKSITTKSSKTIQTVVLPRCQNTGRFQILGPPDTSVDNSAIPNVETTKLPLSSKFAADIMTVSNDDRDSAYKVDALVRQLDCAKVYSTMNRSKASSKLVASTTKKLTSKSDKNKQSTLTEQRIVEDQQRGLKFKDLKSSIDSSPPLQKDSNDTLQHSGDGPTNGYNSIESNLTVEQLPPSKPSSAEIAESIEEETKENNEEVPTAIDTLVSEKPSVATSANETVVEISSVPVVPNDIVNEDRGLDVSVLESNAANIDEVDEKDISTKPQETNQSTTDDQMNTKEIIEIVTTQSVYYEVSEKPNVSTSVDEIVEDVSSVPFVQNDIVNKDRGLNVSVFESNAAYIDEVDEKHNSTKQEEINQSTTDDQRNNTEISGIVTTHSVNDEDQKIEAVIKSYPITSEASRDTIESTSEPSNTVTRDMHDQDVIAQDEFTKSNEIEAQGQLNNAESVDVQLVVNGDQKAESLMKYNPTTAEVTLDTRDSTSEPSNTVSLDTQDEGMTEKEASNETATQDQSNNVEINEIDATQSDQKGESVIKSDPITSEATLDTRDSVSEPSNTMSSDIHDQEVTEKEELTISNATAPEDLKDEPVTTTDRTISIASHDVEDTVSKPSNSVSVDINNQTKDSSNDEATKPVESPKRSTEGTSRKSSKSDFTVYGCTSFAAKHVLNYLMQTALHIPKRLKLTLAGRNKDKLIALQKDLDEKMKCLLEINNRNNCGFSFDVLVAESSDRTALKTMALRTKVVLNCAGPFSKYGSLVVAVCAENGTDYVDITGEVTWAGQMRISHGDAAKKSGARIISLCGFDSIPSDISIFAAIQALREKVPSARNLPIAEGVTWHAAQGGINGGTVHTLQDMSLNLVRCFTQPVPFLVDDPLVLAHPKKRFDPKLQETKNRMAWAEWKNQLPSFDSIFLLGASAPFFMAVANAKVVYASALALNYGKQFVYRERFLPVGFQGTKALSVLAIIPAIIVQFSVVLAMIVVRLPFVGKFLTDQFLPPGSGPSDKSCSSAKTEVYAQVTTSKDKYGRIHRASCYAKFSGDPGNFVTAQCLCESAWCLLLHSKELPPKSEDGFGTPAELLGPVLLKRLMMSKVRPVSVSTKTRENVAVREWSTY